MTSSAGALRTRRRQAEAWCKHSWAALLGLSCGLVATAARAGGYDTPILYTARHQGMGGTAIGYVDDASATFHNPAGLDGISGFGATLAFSPVFARIQSTPATFASAENARSNRIFAPFFLAGAGYRVHEWISLGIGFFPVASGGAEYEYENPGTGAPILDSTNIVFLELTPAVSLNVPKDALLPGNLSIGVGYRMDFLSFERLQGNPDDPQALNLDMSGASVSGYRVGAKYRPNDMLSFGVVYRSRVDITAEADTASVFAQPATNAELPFVLPARLGFGARVDWERFGFATDFEWAFQSQNDRVDLSGEINGTPAAVTNVFEWQDAPTVRLGAEYRVGEDQEIPLRVGYIFDGKTTNLAYPSAFGTPPAPTHSITLGAGYVAEVWQANVAAAHRFGSVTISDADLANPAECRFCSFAGDYELSAWGVYLDASVDLPL